MTSTVQTFTGSALKAGRTRTGEPQLFNDNILSHMKELISTLRPGALIQIEKTYRDGTSQEARLVVLNDYSVMKSGEMEMVYSVGGFPLKAADLAADLSLNRSKIKVVTISVLF